MSHPCPRPCARLATAAILISLGVVQLAAGVILLKSRYVYLLSAPDFWTAVCNFAVGGLLGVSTGVWKSTSKQCAQHSIRRNVLAALVASSILMNMTTLIILVLGEGDTLLSIHLEKEGILGTATLASEILAYAYAASVCSTIFAVVVAILYLTGMCFSKCGKSRPKIEVLETDPSAFGWVYNPERRCLPKPDPEIVRKALSSKSFTSSDDSYGATHPDSALFLDSSLKRGIRAIRKQNANEFLQRVYRRTEYIQDYPDASGGSHDNGIPSVDDSPDMDLPVRGRRIQNLIQSGISSEPCNPSLKMKTSDVHGLSYEPRNVYAIEKQKRKGMCSSRNTSSVSNPSITSVRSNRQSMVVSSEEIEYTPPGVVNFGESLHRFEHQHLRRTSTGTDLVGNSVGRASRDVNSPTESINSTVVQRTMVENSEQILLSPTDLSVDDSGKGFPLQGKVVPIRVNTFPRKKQAIPVSIPVIPRTNACMNEQAEYKFEESRKNGLSSFHGGCKMKNRSKSTGSQTTDHSVPIFSSAKTSVAPLEEHPLQLSLTHTSGYASAVEDSVGPSSIESSESNKGTTSNASSSAGSQSSGYASARRKFRAAQRKILDGGRPLSPNAIDDIVMGIINEIPLFSKT